ncbi:16S rRNA (cytosine(1402)-N(4))-methyltransferase [Microbacterium sp. AISO3]|jgi:16S rRNA (cytosine1402-N4)-methyltransferase|uniref:Ribosomal RNA small subunit methyltransferase H n=1 Tax=Microbacterium paludicola TaxID=300019 RepID=A0ABU1HXE2_9MICO|nr:MULTISPECIES: 16S rRNA (cytosine(1402)-N(4))-methyltransferase RsmH [Microbacterium]APF33682.1 16S rRNA (cytosine(1402)-N(4))-methyltransferase [Microbacterium paludicola]MDR6165942.1 16S rRNA (cytosine1402-N4)-methyltransferase [Microbacterium paludicola]OWP22257.1 16S rRNA (cytosine(1402)-N(4))-methyltransferase [Microbacterium sp. AISO3]POX67367.1 16S rRNA (cytosine(1402)-N(4))-methyltransferase RsmH [Microbacterium sp. Ru50]QCR39982.1 16S rRNA (cytosine(1402)-N(4))-methyltransferase Rsm
MTNDDIHTPVLLDRCVELLAPALQREGAVVVDATEGMGGHSEALLERFPGVRLVGLDRDTDALRIAGERLARFGDRVALVHTVYDGIREALDSLGIRRVDGILFDLGVSSLQLDEADRGFAYAQDAPLDMRMDQTAGTTAADILATYSEGNLRRIFERYGEEKLAGRYARAIIEARGRAPLTRSGELVDVLIAATPVAVQRDRAGHPAKRVFQALRIEVNAELAVLERALPAALEALAVGGRIVVMSYQSLEDRAVKRVLAEASSSTAPSGLPVELPEHAPRFRLLVRGAELASEEERERNPRATPVRLRAAERMREAS